jgi:hypothetical protein
MVELEPDDYTEILNWFTLAYGKTTTMKELDDRPLRVFWKLTFLAEDKIKRCKEELE